MAIFTLLFMAPSSFWAGTEARVAERGEAVGTRRQRKRSALWATMGFCARQLERPQTPNHRQAIRQMKNRHLPFGRSASRIPAAAARRLAATGNALPSCRTPGDAAGRGCVDCPIAWLRRVGATACVLRQARDEVLSLCHQNFPSSRACRRARDRLAASGAMLGRKCAKATLFAMKSL